MSIYIVAHACGTRRNVLVRFLQNKLSAILQNNPLRTPLHDVATQHFSTNVSLYTNEQCSGRWIIRTLNWPPRSSVLSPLIYYVWGHKKNMVFGRKVDTRRVLLQRASDAARHISNAAVLRQVTCHIVKRTSL
jgi:hypothetical protein